MSAPSVLVVGLGLIGASFALAVRRSGRAREVLGFDAQSESIDIAADRGIIDRGGRLVELAQQADVLMLAVPVMAVRKVLADIESHLPDHCIITDVGSVKREFDQCVREIIPHRLPYVVPGHPIAGAEKSGVTAAKPDLFAKHNVILTPLDQTLPESIEVVRNLWEGCHAHVVEMPVQRHDEVLAATSHVPHLLAFSLVDTLAKAPDNHDVFHHAAGGFRDFTRIAASDPVMWRDIFIANKEATLQVLDRFSSDLNTLKQAIAAENGDYMTDVFQRSRTARNQFARILTQRALDRTSGPRLRVTLTVEKALAGDLYPTGDRVTSHHALILAALADGESVFESLAQNESVLATTQALQELGVEIHQEDHLTRVKGVGNEGFTAPSGDIYVAESSTSLRLLTGLLVSQPFTAKLTASKRLDQLSLMPMVAPLKQMNAHIELGPRYSAPVTIYGRNSLHSATVQAGSGGGLERGPLMLAALQAKGVTTIRHLPNTPDHMERWLAHMGAGVVSSLGQVQVAGGGEPLRPASCQIPGDTLLSGFYAALAILTPGSEILLHDVSMNPTRSALVSVLHRMGALLQVSPGKLFGPEPTANIRVRASELNSTHIAEFEAASMVHELPLLIALAAHAQRETTIAGVGVLRDNLSDRLTGLMTALAKLGIQTELHGDVLSVQGGELKGGVISAQNDPVLTIALMLLQCRNDQLVEITEPGDLSGLYPEWPNWSQFGVHIREETV